MGQRFFEATMPNAVREIGRLVDAVVGLKDAIEQRLPLRVTPVRNPDRPRVLLVDDDRRLLRGYERTLKDHCDVWIADSVVQALRLLVEQDFDLIVTDFQMPTCDGVTLLEEVQRTWPTVKRILTSGRPAQEFEEHVETGLAHCFLAKPVDSKMLLASLRKPTL